MGIFAHPDDESLGNGGTFAKYASEGVETYIVTATRGEQGWFDEPENYPGPDELGRIREEELRCAAEVLGIRDIFLFDYHDGELGKAHHSEVIEKVVKHIREVRPHVVLTFDQYGVYGHPDHIAICEQATSAIVAAADASYADSSGAAPHRVSKLYYMTWRTEEMKAYEAAFGDLVMNIDGVERRSVVWPDWSISTWVDTGDNWKTAWKAITCHCSQLPGYQKLLDLPEEYHRSLWGTQTYRRIFSLVDAPDREDDLFAGLR
jgi:LmbE family N-acetylglucosaminyl deacetylase